MKKTTFIVGGIILAAMFAAAYFADGRSAAANTQRAETTQAETAALTKAVARFNHEYYSTLDRNGNIFYSPYGIASALSLVANGAEGETQKEILHALAVDSVKTLNDAHGFFQKRIGQKYAGDNRLSEASLILINKAYAKNGIKKGFQKTAEKNYGSDVREADFSGNIEGEKQNIARWVDEKTEHFIPDYKSIVTPGTTMDLLNVIWFKGKWEMPFKAHNTHDGTFTNKDGSETTAKMMSAIFKNKIAYFEDDKYKGIELPYKKDANGNTTAAMYLIMPKNRAALDIADAWAKESSVYKEAFIKNLKESPVFDGKADILLPKFELDIENKIVDNLKAMGLRLAFSNDAEFFGIIDGVPLKIDDVKHQAKIRIDETGTEAAAVTEMTMLATAAMPMPEKIVEFHADRPFLFVIRDIESDIDLFTGTVNKL